MARTTGTTWPGVDDVAARLGVPWASPADQADAATALAAAIAYAERNSTVYRRGPHAGTVTADVWRGVLDLTVALYERRGANVDPFDALTPAQRAHFDRLLGVGWHALPMIGGAGAAPAAPPAPSPPLFWHGTQAQYDALGVYDPETLYVIVSGP